MVSLKYLFWRPTNTLKTWFHENICFGELSSTQKKIAKILGLNNNSGVFHIAQVLGNQACSPESY